MTNDTYIHVSDAIALLDGDIDLYNDMVLFDFIRETLCWNEEAKACTLYVRRSEVLIAQEMKDTYKTTNAYRKAKGYTTKPE